MGLLSNIAAETLKSTGQGMARTLREQAQESRENALLNKKMEHDKAMAQTGRDARIEAEILRDTLAGNRSNAEHKRNKGRFTQGSDQYGRYQEDSHTGKKDYYGSKGSNNRFHFEKTAEPDGTEQIRVFDKQTGQEVLDSPSDMPGDLPVIAELPGGRKVSGSGERVSLAKLEDQAELQRVTTGGQYATGTPLQSNLEPMQAAAQVISALSRNEQIPPDMIQQALPYLPPELKAKAQALLPAQTGLLQLQ